jgi:hypothetical protein
MEQKYDTLKLVIILLELIIFALRPHCCFRWLADDSVSMYRPKGWCGKHWCNWPGQRNDYNRELKTSLKAFPACLDPAAHLREGGACRPAATRPHRNFKSTDFVDKMISTVLRNFTLSKPIFLPTAYSPALICFGRGKGWWSTCNYPTVLKEKDMEKQN